MQEQFQIRQAKRSQAKLRIGLFGPSGSGKTFSALKLARGMATDWNKVLLLDTENGSGDLYSHLGNYNVITLRAPFAPERYIEALHAAEDAGMEVIILDSITHEWAGQGGILELVEQLEKAERNSFAIWGKLTPRHNRFIDSILQSPAHVICCGRSKQDWVLNQKEKNGKIINVPEKVGLKAVTRDGFDYEMTISFDLAINHFATTSKDRTGVFMDRPEFLISDAVGQEILKWNLSGAAVAKDQTIVKRKIMAECKRLGIDYKAADFPVHIKRLTNYDLIDENMDAILAFLVSPLMSKELSMPAPKQEVTAEDIAAVDEEENIPEYLKIENRMMTCKILKELDEIWRQVQEDQTLITQLTAVQIGLLRATYESQLIILKGPRI